MTRLIGKARTMELILTGEFITAYEAAERGIVSRVVESDNLIDEALNVASKIASHSKVATRMAKECVKQSYEMSLKEGMKYE